MISVFKKSDPTVELIRDPNVPTEGLVFYAPLDVAATTAETGQELITSGNVIYETVDGIPSAYFDGSSTIYMPDNSADIATLPSGNSPSTMSVWFKSTGDEWGNIVAYSGSDDTARCIWLHSDGTISSSDGSNIMHGAGFRDDTNHFGGNWCHALITYNGTTLELYIDGVRKSTYAISLNTDTIRFGIANWPWTHNTYYFTGYLAGCRIYDRVLSQDEITRLSNEDFDMKRTTYHTSEGFNALGRPVRYRSAYEAGCAASRIPEDGLVFYAPLDKAANAAATGQKLTEAGSGDISYRTVDGIPWVYFDGHSGYTTPAIDVSTFPDGFTASAFIKMERNGPLLSRRNATWHCQYSLSPYGFWSARSDGVEYLVTMEGATNLTNYVAHVAWRYHDYTVDWFLDGKMYQSGGVYLGYQDSGETKIGISYYDSIGESYKGYLAALRIYNRALSDNEIKALSKEFKV